jgi:hypothetical protein
MKKISIFLFIIVIGSCSTNEYRQLSNGNIISPNKTEYIFFANEGKYAVFGERTFISHIMFQPRKLKHMDGNTNTGIYSINNDPDLTILHRIKYNSEFYELYIRKELSQNDYIFENCNSFKFCETKNQFTGYYFLTNEYLISLESISGIDNDDEIKIFVEDIKNNEINTDEHILSILKNPFDTGNEGFVGYIYGFFNEIPNLAFPGTVWIDDDGVYYLNMDKRMYKISIKWLKKLGYNK